MRETPATRAAEAKVIPFPARKEDELEPLPAPAPVPVVEAPVVASPMAPAPALERTLKAQEVPRELRDHDAREAAAASANAGPALTEREPVIARRMERSANTSESSSTLILGSSLIEAAQAAFAAAASDPDSPVSSASSARAEAEAASAAAAPSAQESVQTLPAPREQAPTASPSASFRAAAASSEAKASPSASFRAAAAAQEPPILLVAVPDPTPPLVAVSPAHVAGDSFADAIAQAPTIAEFAELEAPPHVEDTHDEFFSAGEAGAYEGGPRHGAEPESHGFYDLGAEEDPRRIIRRTPEQDRRRELFIKYVPGVIGILLAIPVVAWWRSHQHVEPQVEQIPAPLPPPVVTPPPPPAAVTTALPPAVEVPPPPPVVETPPAPAEPSVVAPVPPPEARPAPAPAHVREEAPRAPAAASPAAPAAPARPAPAHHTEPAPERPTPAPTPPAAEPGRPPTAAFPL